MQGPGSVGMMDGTVDGTVREAGGGIDVGGVGRLDFVGIVDFDSVEIDYFDSVVVVAAAVAAGSGDSDSVIGTVVVALCCAAETVCFAETEDSAIEVGIVDLG